MVRTEQTSQVAQPPLPVTEEEINSEAQMILLPKEATSAATAHDIQTMPLQMMDLDQKALKRKVLMRGVKAIEANYLPYLDKPEQERTSDSSDQRRIADVPTAVPPSKPPLRAVSPLVIFLIGFFLAVGLSVLAAFVVEFVDPSLGMGA
jgi:hypothetical protein